MTKTSIFGQSEVKQEEKKPIEAIKFLNSKGEFQTASHDLNYDIRNGMMKSITLLKRDDCLDRLDGLDVFIGDRGDYQEVYLGHWNDGVIK
jgi:hypothetical protein